MRKVAFDFEFLYKSGLGSCIAPQTGLARHPVRGGLAAEEPFVGPKLVPMPQDQGVVRGTLAVPPASKDAESPSS